MAREGKIGDRELENNTLWSLLAFSQEEFERREDTGFFPLKCGRTDRAVSEEIEKESLKSESVGYFDPGERKE